MKGRKRQIAVDSLGLLLRVLVHPANERDTVGGEALLRRSPYTARCRQLVLCEGYDSPAFLNWCTTMFDVEALIVRRLAEPGYVVLPIRWIAERTLVGLGRSRHLSKDYEALPCVSESFIYLAMIHLMLHRLARNS